MKYEEKGKFGFLLDDVLGLSPYQSATRWVRELAVEYPFRQAMSLLRDEIENEISHRTIHHWAQEEGKKLRGEEEARQEAVLGQAEKVPNDGKQREIVVLEVDRTMIQSRERGEDDFEAKLGIMYLAFPNFSNAFARYRSSLLTSRLSSDILSSGSPPSLWWFFLR